MHTVFGCMRPNSRQATLDDFVWWSGLAKNDARSGLEMIASQQVRAGVERQTVWFPELQIPPAVPTRAGFLLPNFDEYVVGYTGRSAVLDERHTVRLDSRGVSSPTTSWSSRVKSPAPGSAPSQLDYTVPVVLNARTTGGGRRVFSGCYLLHLSNPGIQAEPPFIPLGIERANLQPAALDADEAGLLASACPEPSNPIPPQPVTHPDDLRAGNYLDDRSDPVQALRSLFNAVNRKEYARADSDWENAGTNSGAPPFDRFAAGYAGTEAVEPTTGAVSGAAGAGQGYASVPVVLTARTAAGEIRAFAGCYQLHLANPRLQAEPPFRPLAIQPAVVNPADPDAEPADLLEGACAP